MTPNDLERMIGADATMRLMSRRAGQVIYVPKIVTPVLLDIAGSKAGAERMIAEHGGDRSNITAIGHSAGGHLAAMLLAWVGTS